MPTSKAIKEILAEFDFKAELHWDDGGIMEKPSMLSQWETKRWLESKLISLEETIKNKLTHELDLDEMLPGWERHWRDVGDGRYVEYCMECENATKIIELLSTNQLDTSKEGRE